MNQSAFIIPETSIREQAQKDGITHFSTGIAVMKGDTVLMVRRVPDDFLGGNYELPGGGVDDGESFEQGVIRETLEETGLRVIAITGMFEGFDYSTDRKPHVRQLNVMVKTDSEHVVLNPEEHDAFAWVGEKEFTDLPMSEKMHACIQKLFKHGKKNNKI